MRSLATSAMAAMAAMAIVGVVSIGIALPALPALASVRALPAPVEAPIDRSTLNAASPRAPGADNPAREKMLKSLRSAAQTDGGPSRPPRPPKARAGAEMAPADAAWLLGLLALHGLAMPTDLPQAQHWFERAQLLGHPMAPAGLAWCQISGCVAAPNPAAALLWIAQLRRTDSALASYLEWHATKALTPLSAPLPSVASPPAGPALHKLLTDAARGGNAQARNELGLDYLSAGDLDQALAQFQAAAPKSEAAASNAALLASRIHSGPAASTRSARFSAADWHAAAQRYHRGDGVPANYTEAVRLYQIAATAGDPQARRMLELIFSRPAPDGTIDITWMQQLASIDLGPRGGSPGQRGAAAPQGWQRDPSPLYDWVPPDWRTSGTPPRR